jgi:hypothetical protein
MLTVFGMAWITTVWLVLTAPVTLILVVGTVAAFYLGPLRGQPVGLSRWLSVAPAPLFLAIVVLGGTFGSPRIEPPPQFPTSAWTVVALYAVLFFVVVLAVMRAKRRWVAAAAMSVWGWTGAVAAWVAIWAITSGGTLGAL